MERGLVQFGNSFDCAVHFRWYKVPHCDGKGESNHFFTDAGVPTTFLLTSFYFGHPGEFLPQRAVRGRPSAYDNRRKYRLVGRGNGRARAVLCRLQIAAVAWHWKERLHKRWPKLPQTQHRTTSLSITFPILVGVSVSCDSPFGAERRPPLLRHRSFSTGATSNSEFAMLRDPA